MFTRLFIMFYAIVSYLIFTASFLYALGFFSNNFVPKSIDIGGSSNLIGSIFVDLLLLGLFAVQHSVMARPFFKRWWATILPVASQRSTYVLLSSLILILLFWQWQPIPTLVWKFDGLLGGLLTGIYWLGWLLVLTSSYLIDHFDLFGLRQSYDAIRGTDCSKQDFRTPLIYKGCRESPTS